MIPHSSLSSSSKGAISKGTITTYRQTITTHRQTTTTHTAQLTEQQQDNTQSQGLASPRALLQSHSLNTAAAAAVDHDDIQEAAQLQEQQQRPDGQDRQPFSFSRGCRGGKKNQNRRCVLPVIQAGTCHNGVHSVCLEAHLEIAPGAPHMHEDSLMHDCSRCANLFLCAAGAKFLSASTMHFDECGTLHLAARYVNMGLQCN